MIAPAADAPMPRAQARGCARVSSVAPTPPRSPLELARVCKAWARVPAGIANARARSLAAPIANRGPQKSSGGGRKCSQLFHVENEGGGGRGDTKQMLACLEECTMMYQQHSFSDVQ